MINPERQIWRELAQRLHQWGLQGWVAALIEAAGPLTLLGAQIIYVGQPLLRQVMPDRQIQALAGLLEEPEMARAFAAYLREETPT